MEHRWRKGHGDKIRQGSEAEQALHVCTPHDSGPEPYGEPHLPGYNYDDTVTGIAGAYDTQSNILPSKRIELFPDESATHEMVPAYVARENNGWGLVVQDVGGPYELYGNFPTIFERFEATRNTNLRCLKATI